MRSRIAYPNEDSDTQTYAVHNAAIIGDVRGAHVCLRKDPDAASRYNLNGLTPFHIMVMHYATPYFDQLLELLREFKTDVRMPIRQYPHDTALHLAIRYVRPNDLTTMIDKLCDAGCESIKRQKNDDNYTAWELAEDLGLAQYCGRLDPNRVDGEKDIETKLAEAVIEARFDDIKELLSRGADVFKSSRADEDTVLHQIAKKMDVRERVNGHVYSAISIILAVGADVFKINREKETPIDIAESRGLNDIGLLMRQADLTFEANEFQPNQTSRVVVDRWRKVIEAARAKKLQEDKQQQQPTKGKQVKIANQPTQESETSREPKERKTVPPDQQPLLLAVINATKYCNSLHEFKIFIAELVRLGANINLVNQEDGNNCLHYAVLSNQSGVVDLLMRLGVETTLKNKNNKTPLELAREKRYAAIQKLLSDYQSQKPLDDWGKLADPCTIL